MLILGEYREIYEDTSLPSIHDYISSDEQKNKNKILDYLKKGQIKACAAGKAIDIFTGEVIPNELSYMTDGQYEWRSDLIHYVQKYNLILDKQFIKHVLNQ